MVKIEEKYEDRSPKALFGELTKLYFVKNFKLLSDKGIHPGQAALLELIAGEDGLSQKQIAERLNVRPPTVAVSIKRMENSGLLHKITDDKDRRMTRVFITDKGKALIEEVKLAESESDRLIYQGVSEEELRMMKRVIIQFIKNIKNTIDETEVEKVMEEFKLIHRDEKEKSE